MRIGILGHGIELTPEVTDVKTMFPLLGHGLSGEFRPVLIQGSPGVRVTPEGKGMVIEWNALFGYYIDGARARRNLAYKSFNKETAWRQAAKFGHYAYGEALKEVTKRSKGPSRATLDPSANIPNVIEVLTDEYYTLEDIVMDIMDERMLWQPGNIRESTGGYRWIGLGTRGATPQYPATRIVIPDVLQSTKPLTFRGHVNPMSETENMPITPRTDWAQTSTICGIIHAFADREQWDPRTSIWAAHFERVFGPGMMSIDKLFMAACREGVTPRLSTPLQVANTETTYPAYDKLAALAITMKWFSLNYWGGMKGSDRAPHVWKDNTGRVQYWISGTTPAAILQGKIQRFSRANMTIFGTRQAPTGSSPDVGASGLYYFPVSNAHGMGHRLAFCAMPGEDNAVNIDLTPSEEPRLYAELSGDTLHLDKNQVLIRTDEQALSDSWFPVTVELSRSVTQMTQFLPLGLRRYSRMVRDAADPVPVKPLELLKTMMTGWGMLYPPASAIFTGVAAPSYLDEFSDFEVVAGRGAAL